MLLLLSRFSRVQTLCDPIDGSPPGSPVPGILQARTLEWVAISSFMLSHLNCVRLFATLRTAAHQAPLSTGFSRQEYWSGLPCPPPGDLSDPGIELAFLVSPALADRFFTTSATWEVRRMNLKSVIQNEVSQKEKNKFIWNLENGTDQPICMAGIETQM